jgi:uncharacterized peroxidase-related enzyme
VREMYDRVLAEQGGIPDWARVFSLHPEVRAGWASLIGAIRGNLDIRTYELVTLAAARALRSSYCSLAHGRVLADKVFDAGAVTTIALGDGSGVLEPREIAMMKYAAKVTRRANEVTAQDITELRAHGYTDEQIFDIAATVAARCFFSTLLDALGVQPDAHFNDLEPALRTALTVGRPVASEVMAV